MADKREIRVKLVPELSEDMQALLGTATEDTLEKVAAGGELIYALYHAGRDVALGLPDPVSKALARAQRAYRVGRD